MIDLQNLDIFQLNEFKQIVISVKNLYGNKLATYDLTSTNYNNSDNIEENKLEYHKKFIHYQNIIESLDRLIELKLQTDVLYI